MDFANLDTVEGSNKGFELRLFNPTTLKDLDIWITVLGRDSDEYRNLSNAHQQKRISKMSRAGSVRATFSTPEEFDREAVELLAAVTKSWRQVEDGKERDTLTVKKEELVCGKENAARLYKEYPWVKEQVDAAVLDRANFLKR